MRALIPSGGVIGATAFFLADDGHEVTLIERQGDVALSDHCKSASRIAFRMVGESDPKLLSGKASIATARQVSETLRRSRFPGRSSSHGERARGSSA